jgi:hypothetical protein
MAQTVAFCAPISVCAVLSTTLSLIVKPADQLSISAHTHANTRGERHSTQTKLRQRLATMTASLVMTTVAIHTRIDQCA